MLKEKEIVDLVPDTFEKEGGVLLRITRCIVGHPTKVETYNTDGFRASLTDAEIAFWTNAHLGQHNAKPEQSIEEVCPRFKIDVIPTEMIYPKFP